jgi:hypothetical protein
MNPQMANATNQELQYTESLNPAERSIPHLFDANSVLTNKNALIPEKVAPRPSIQMGNPSLQTSFIDIGMS